MRRALIPYAIPFRRRIATGAGEWSIRRGAWLRLVSEDGLEGLGEVAPLGRISSAVAASLAEEGPLFDAALELARLDVQGQREGRSIAAILGGEPRAAVACNALCFEEDVAAAGREAAEAVSAGFATLKLKVGAATPDRDIERIREVRRQAAGARLRLDANGAWDLASAARVLRAVAGPDIEYVEDPVAGGIAAGRDVLQVPVAADVRSLDEGWRVVRGRSADFLVLKPMALGGLAASRALAVAAIESGLGVVITSVFDTAVGVAGALHLAASLPGPPRAHGLATVALLEEAPLEGLDPPHAGMQPLPRAAGLGVRLRERAP